MKEENKYPTFSARVPRSLFNKVEEYRSAHRLSKSEILRVALREYIERHASE